MPPSEADLRAAEIAAAEARTDTKIMRLEGKMDTLLATITGKLDAARDVAVRDHDYNRNTRWLLAGLIVACFGLLVGVMSYGNDQFSRGLSVRDVVQTVIKEQREIEKKEATPSVPPRPQ